MPKRAMPAPGLNEECRRSESRAILERASRDSEVIGSSAVARDARETPDEIAAPQGGGADGVERWAARIGRGLGFVFAAYLIMHLARVLAG